MVTHQVHFLTNVNKIILLNNGEIKLAGTYDELINAGIEMNMLGLNETEDSFDNILMESKLIRTLSNASKHSRLSPTEKLDKELHETKEKVFIILCFLCILIINKSF